MKTIFVVFILLLITQVHASNISEVSKLLGGRPYINEKLNPTENQKLFNKYCLGKARSTDIPQPNYSDKDVQKAARKLSQAKEQAFYFYGPIRKMYQLDSTTPVPQNLPGLTLQTHMLLVQLCGEFRDRATMIEAKINWYKNLFVLPATPQKAIDPKKNIWSQMTANAYPDYIQLSHQLWEAKRQAQPRYITLTPEKQIDNPVQGTTVCETKYMFAEYISKKRQFESLDQFQAGLKKYEALCPKEDLTDYYDFRGDSNIKHNSPEANAMIWYSTSIANACKTMTQAKENQAGVTDQDCKNYFEQPFYYRYNAARAGLATWLFQSSAYKEQFADSRSEVAIFPHTQPHLAPMSYGFDHTTPEEVNEFDTNWLNIPGAWNSNDIGFNTFTGMGSSTPSAPLVYELIRSAVDRHTDWYASSYNDKNGTLKNQAYSPLVASSYEMSESDQFTFCGITVPCPPDGHKRWMFIFRVKAENWYTPARALNGEPVNFDTMWFDETSFGETGLADSEKAWDRLGTPMEGEMDSILYLYNIGDNGQLIDPQSPDIIQPIAE